MKKTFLVTACVAEFIADVIGSDYVPFEANGLGLYAGSKLLFDRGL